MKDPSKKTTPNGRRTLDIPMGKSTAPQTNRREQKREYEKDFRNRKEISEKYFRKEMSERFLSIS